MATMSTAKVHCPLADCPLADCRLADCQADSPSMGLRRRNSLHELASGRRVRDDQWWLQGHCQRRRRWRNVPHSGLPGAPYILVCICFLAHSSSILWRCGAAASALGAHDDAASSPLPQQTKHLCKTDQNSRPALIQCNRSALTSMDSNPNDSCTSDTILQYHALALPNRETNLQHPSLPTHITSATFGGNSTEPSQILPLSESEPCRLHGFTP